MKKTVLCMAGLLLFACSRAQDRVAEEAMVLAARPWMSRHVSAAGVRMELRGLYMCGGLLWVWLRAENRSAIDFRGNVVRFGIRDKHAVRREAVQEIRLVPVVSRGPSVLCADSTASFCYGLAPRVPGRKRELVIEWGERNGDRRMRLRVRGKYVLRARRL